MSKNIIVCCDGTGNEFGDRNSNVVKLYKTLVRDAAQIAYYHPGVGTMGSRSALSGIGKWWTRVIGLAFGYGLSDNVADAYQFLMRNFEAGDKVYVFGFSRGAYTARALCGMLHIVGLLTQGNEGLIPYAIRMIKKKNLDFPVAAGFKKTFARECKPYFVGVWDTVSSVGWIYNAVRFPYTNASSNPDFHIVRHAMSIDERRAFFRQNLFGKPRDQQQDIDIKEVWFAGVHSDVGGSYAEKTSQLSKISLQWMLDEAELSGLRVDEHRKADILGVKPTYVAPDSRTKNMHKSLRGVWWIAELWPKISHKKTADGEWKKTIRLNLARRRWISPDPPPLVHESVDQRLNWVPPDPVVIDEAGHQELERNPFPYKPGNLPEKHEAVG
ncbi:MAG TPA: DUF2235 domain-containing protein [Candidatus Angelobacter sp.]